MRKSPVIFTEEASFGTIEVAEYTNRMRPYRMLLVNGAMESALFCEPAMRELLLFPYMNYFDQAAGFHLDARRCLLLGGGGFAYPWHFLSVFPGQTITVIERFPEIVRIAREFFWLDELEARYPGRLWVETGDGFAAMDATAVDGDRAKPTFDVIINDAFVGQKGIGRQKKETARIKAQLSEGGIYVINMTAALRGFGALPGIRFRRLLGHYFRHVDYVVCENDRDPWESQNLVVAASDTPVMLS